MSTNVCLQINGQEEPAVSIPLHVFQSGRGVCNTVSWGLKSQWTGPSVRTRHTARLPGRLACS